ncbi:MAG TPA: histidine kinase N-terminal 7TM domain-containing protein, partial [Bellilinea sp.]|nr:histidine kinase N-terminal 7TM domain-containing protein [Bellilinea sp.]
MNTLGSINQILMAGIAITAFSLLLYSLTFNLRVRVARSFSGILACLVMVYVADSLASVAESSARLEFWLKAQWIGIVFLPSAYLHFSDAVLATTGKPSKGKRRWTIRFSYLISLIFLASLFMGVLVGPVVERDTTAPFLEPTWLTDAFMLYYIGAMLMSWYNFIRAYQRSATATGQRRMGYLLVGSIAPTLGSFPFLLFSSGFAARHTLIFWLVTVLSNLAVGGLVIVMAYSVAFFGVALPDRRVKSRLFKWILRGPVVASFTLTFVTIVRRAGVPLGLDYNTFVPIVMVATILVGEYLVTLLFPVIERILFFGNDKSEIAVLEAFEDKLITRNDLRQFIEMMLTGLCDRMQMPGAYVAAFNADGLKLVVKVGKTFFDRENENADLSRFFPDGADFYELFQWGSDILIPLYDQNDDGDMNMLGILGIAQGAVESLDDDQLEEVNTFSERISLALKDRRLQEQVFQSLGELSSQTAFVQQMRAAGRFDQSQVLPVEETSGKTDFSQWVKDALTHYWGGPKLTDSPLMKLKVVQEKTESVEGNSSNALRAILREAIERTRPEGDRRFTGEWVLYN